MTLPTTFPPSVEYAILSAGLRDLSALRGIEQECFGVDAWPLIDLLGVLTLPGVLRLKAVVGEQMVGFAGVDRRSDEGIAWIATIGVRTAYRKMGIGSALLRACEQQAGMKSVRLCVRKSNFDAIRLYARFGYRQVDVWAKYYASGEDALVMEKVIDFPPNSLYDNKTE